MANKHIYFGLAIHNHQPVGQFPWVFEQAYRQAYLPLVETLELHPQIRLSMHYSGPVIDWLLEQHPEFLPRLAALVKREQVEMMTGGYYEPILPLTPEADRVGQIAKLTAALRRYFGMEATGLWLTERVWEPHLPRSLAEAGVQWTVVDDAHFKAAGLEDDELFGYYLTEEEGRNLKVFVTPKKLRYLIIPGSRIREIMSYLEQQATQEGPRIAVMGDDGEKFGLWPGALHHCWGPRGWVERFFHTLEQNQNWVTTIPLGEYARRFPPAGRVYLPTSSYDEMGEWALPAPVSYRYTTLRHQMEAAGRSEVTRFLRGGFFRYFLVKYPEANLMHKKMLRVHRKVHQARALTGADVGLDELWKGQCSCGYWHGVFGGLYLADIRAANYHHLLRAEAAADAVLHPEGTWLGWRQEDLDGDGLAELLVESNDQSLYLAPAHGGTLLEWDWYRVAFNLASTLARRPEAYHFDLLQEEKEEAEEKISGRAPSIHELRWRKEAGLKELLAYDSYSRACLRDHFLDPATTLESFQGASFSEEGDFADKPYACSLRQEDGGLRIILSREGQLRQRERWLPFRVDKELFLTAGSQGLSVNYRLSNTSQEEISGLFASEWNFNLLGGGANPLAYYRVPGRRLRNARLDSSGEITSVEELALGNQGLGIEVQLKLSRRLNLWRFPVETVSNSEAGLERSYQGSCLAILAPFRLAVGASLSLSLDWNLVGGS